MNAVPVSVALVAGGLAVVHRCGFLLLPAFLSFYLGADEHKLPRAPTRALLALVGLVRQHLRLEATFIPLLR